MAVILVVEQDAGYINRIAASLRGDGFDVATASNRDEGMALAAARHPSLVLVSGTLSGSRELLGEFSRRRGGPGSVVILPVTLAEMSTPEQYQADDILTKPFSVDDLRALVERRLSGVETPGAEAAPTEVGSPSTPSPAASASPANSLAFGGPGSLGMGDASGQLTSEDIFGDVLAEVEAEAGGSPRAARAERKRADQADLDRRLEQTLSGVFPTVEETKRSGGGRKRDAAPTGSEIDDLLDKTLSSLELPGRSKKRRSGEVKPLRPQPAPATPAPATVAPTPTPATAKPAATPLPASTPPPTMPASDPTDLSPPVVTGAPSAAPPRPPAQAPPFDPSIAETPAFQAPPTAPFESPRTEPVADELSAATVRIRVEDLPIEPPMLPDPLQAEAAPVDESSFFEPPPQLDEAAASFEPPSFEPPSFEPQPLQPPAESPGAPALDDTGFDRTGWGVIGAPDAPAADAPDVPLDGGDEIAPAERVAAGETLPPVSFQDDAAPSDFSSAFHFEPPERVEGTRSGVVPTASADSGSFPASAAPAAPGPDAAHETLDGVLQIRGHEVDGAADGEPFGDYRLLERVAIGGMAEVWRARRRGVEGFQKTVAIKRILSHLTGSTDFVTMFIDEAKLAAQLTHGNIIQIYDLGKVGEDFFIAMEYVEGKDLRTLLTDARNREQPLPAEQALVVVAAVARALDYAHRKRDFDNRDMGLVHRDVSPQNVLIGYEGEIKLCDFGIAKAVAKASTTQMGALKGKLQYMSPEQAWGKQVDARSDIFSLGSVLFEALTGTKLFQGDSEIGVLDAVRDCRIRSVLDLDPNLPGEVDQIVAKALAKDPDDRYQTAGDMERDIVRVLEGFQPTPTPSSVARYMASLYGAPAASAAAAPLAVDASPVAESGLPVAAPTTTTSGAVEVQGTGTATGSQITSPSPSDTPKKSKLPLLLGALALLALLALAAFFLLGGDQDASTAQPALETTTDSRAADPAAQEAAGPEAADPDAVDPNAVDPDAVGPDAASTDAAGTDAAAVDPSAADADGAAADGTTDVQGLIDEELRAQREALERDFEAERQRIQREIEQVQQAEDDDG